MPPETRYARSGDLNIAYQVAGDGPLDLVNVPGWVSNVELMWESPEMAGFLGRLAAFSRVILFDKRETGLSDRVSNDRLPTLGERMDDVRAVLDAVGSERAALFGHSEGGNMCVLFAATYPERTTALITLGSFAKRGDPDDGFLATFDGPARAVRCAFAAGAAVQTLGVRIRAGIDTGECELDGPKVRGIAVHTEAHIASLAGPDEVLVSQTVKDLVSGSGLAFEDRGAHELKGVPGEWRVYAAVRTSATSMP